MTRSRATSIVDEAIAALDAGDTIVYPTDTVYGLGCRAADEQAVSALRELKGLGPDRPLSILFATIDAADAWAAWTPSGRRWAHALLPGPVTLVVQASEQAPAHLVAPDGSIGVRVVDRPEVVALAAEGPLVSTSTNRTGAPAAGSVAEAREAFGGAVACYVDVGPLAGPASTVVDVRGAEPRLLREGALSRDQLAERVGHG